MPKLPRPDLAVSALLLAMSVACAHSASFTGTDESSEVPFATAAPTRLTYNPGDNYSPAWTEDGKGLLYQYSRLGLISDDRCAALLPPNGGTLRWQLCDDRAEHADSADSFPSIAIGNDGRLLYVEASSRRGSGGASGVNPPPQSVNLWLADTAHPFVRRKLLALPTPVSGVSVNWITGAQWIGPTSFVGLAQVLTPFSNCVSCAFFDSTLTTVALVRGEVTTGGAALTPIAGTEGVARYALAEGNTSIILSSGLDLKRLPVGGGAVTTIASIPPAPGRVITGFNCQASICVVSTRTPVTAPAPSYRLWRVSLAGGDPSDIGEGPEDSPLLSPTSTAIVGRRVVTGSIRALFLYQGLLP